MSCLNFKTQFKSCHSLNNFKQRKWHYLAVKCLSTLLRKVTSKHNGNFYCLICL